MQAYRTPKNIGNDTSKNISNTYAVSDSVKTILTKACNDCHSNNTRYPWYAEVQPVCWWLGDHVQETKKKFNLSEFNGYRIARQYKKLKECIKEVKESGMQLPSYTIIHREVILSDVEKQTLFTWCETIRAKYPADSLVIKKKK